ncbi:MAG TPA: IclR family transcriptional regulator [Solirubrobacterales bacterium]|nr:IclR family transcriptional regulator [Solirubrobacterales bacterium]
MQNTKARAADRESAPRRHGVQTIARAAAVLRALERAPHGLGLGEIATAVELPKSTVHRLVAALAEEDLIAQEPGGKVRLGGGIARLAAAGREALSERLRPILLELRRDLDETVDLAVLDGAAVRFVDQIPAPRRLRASSAAGEVFPLHCSANGKALLAAMPEEQTLALLPRRLPRLTPHTIVSRDELRVELAQIRREGVALDHEEHTEGICAAGAVVIDASGPVAAISVPVPVQRFRGEEERIAERVKGAASTGSELLSGRKPAGAR